MKKCALIMICAILAGCVCNRWQGGTSQGISDSKVAGVYYLESITFDADIKTIGKQPGELPFIRKTVDEIRTGLASAYPDSFSDNKDRGEKIAIAATVRNCTLDHSFFGFIVTLGFIFPQTMRETCDFDISIVDDGRRQRSADLRTVNESWIGEPWTLAVYFSYPDRDESYSESSAWRIYANESEQLARNRTKYRALGKAIVRAIELSRTAK